MIDAAKFDTKEYKVSRGAYTLQCMTEYFISILSADAYLAKLLKDIGLSDAATGVISSLITFTFLFQLLSVPLAGKLRKIKKPVIVLDTLSQLLFASAFAVPFMPLSFRGRSVTVTALIILAYLALYLNTTIAYKWGNSFVSPEKRGSFSATKEMISLISGVIFTLAVGFMVDRFEGAGNLHGAFKFILAVMGTVCLANLICFLKMKEIPLAESGTPFGIREIVSCSFGNKKFRNTIILTALTEISRYLTLGFMGTYKTVDLKMSVGKVQLVNVLSCLGRFAVSRPVGRFSDKKGFSEGYFLGNVISFSAFFIGIFMSPACRWPVVPFTVLLQTSFAGTNMNTYNMAYCYTDDEHILTAIAVNNSVRGICGFAASFAGSRILDKIQRAGNTFCGMNVMGQQVLCAVSSLVALVSLIFNKTVVSKQEEVKR